MTEAPRRQKRHWKALDGVLLLDKPQGLSSNDALQRARRALQAASGGHGGTLDPMATGLLPLAFGEATKFLHDLLEADKTYQATIQLGVRTDTADAEGQVLTREPVRVLAEQVHAVCAEFTGPLLQVPPMHSALKHQGRPLYELARAGQTIDRAARPVTIHRLEVLQIDLSVAQVRIETTVSKGTYIRTLAQDIGERLGCGAHLSALRRTRVGRLDLAQAVALEAFEASSENDREGLLLPVDALLAGLPALQLPDPLALRFTQGQRIILDHGLRATLGPDVKAATPESLVRVYRDAQLLGVAAFEPPGRLAPRRLIRQAGA